MSPRKHLAIAVVAIASFSSTVRGQICTAGSIESDGHTEQWRFGNDDVGANVYFRIRGEKQDDPCWIQSPYLAYSPRHLSVSLRGRAGVTLMGDDIELFEVNTYAGATGSTRSAGLTVELLGNRLFTQTWNIPGIPVYRVVYPILSLGAQASVQFGPFTVSVFGMASGSVSFEVRLTPDLDEVRVEGDVGCAIDGYVGGKIGIPGVIEAGVQAHLRLFDTHFVGTLGVSFTLSFVGSAEVRFVPVYIGLQLCGWVLGAPLCVTIANWSAPPIYRRVSF